MRICIRKSNTHEKRPICIYGELSNVALSRNLPLEMIALKMILRVLAKITFVYLPLGLSSGSSGLSPSSCPSGLVGSVSI